MDYVELKSVSKQYGTHIIFQDINMFLKKGEITAIIGESGSGKSTLLNIIGLLEQPTSGSIHYGSYGEVTLRNRKVIQLLRYEIAYLFQNYALMDNSSVAENLEIALAYKKNCKKQEECVTALQAVNLPSDILNKKIYTLSGGEQQRIALARVLLKPSSLVLADEPTGNLDEKNKDEVFHILKRMAKQDKIVVIVTHDFSIASACDNVITLTK